MSTVTDKRTTAETLRALADFIEENGLRAESFHLFTGLSEARADIRIDPIWGFRTPEEARAAMGAWARALRPCKKDYSDEEFKLYAEKEIGDFRIAERRDHVCRRVVVGTREVPETVVAATEEKVIPARTEEIVEWRCDESILAADTQWEAVA